MIAHAAFHVPSPLPDEAEAPDAALLRLLFRLDHAREVQSRALVDSQGITSRQRTVLRLVGRFPGITPGQLAQRLHVHPSRLTSLIDPLVRRGLVVRGTDPRDRRRQRLGLTSAGMDLDHPLDECLESSIRRALARFSMREIEGTLELIERLVDDIDRS